MFLDLMKLKIQGIYFMSLFMDGCVFIQFCAWTDFPLRFFILVCVCERETLHHCPPNMQHGPQKVVFDGNCPTQTYKKELK